MYTIGKCPDTETWFILRGNEICYIFASKAEAISKMKATINEKQRR